MTIFRMIGAAAVAITSALTCASSPAPAEPRPRTATLSGAQRTMLLDATRRFRDVRQALAAGYLPTEDCVPGMGLHYTHPALTADPRIDPLRPEILLYLAGPHGTVRLAGLEYFRPAADGARPRLLGHPFNGPMAGHPVPPGHPPMPVHYDLHVWLYDDNPAGELASENPRVTCR